MRPEREERRPRQGDAPKTTRQGDPLHRTRELVRAAASRATVGAYLEEGAILPSYLEHVAEELRWLAADLTVRGYEWQADVAFTFAVRCDETAELAQIFRTRDAA
jgi:hypothetical protein